MGKRSRQQFVVQSVDSAMPPLTRKTYTIEEAAEVLGLGRNKVLELIAEKRLRTIPDIGKRVLIPVVAIDEFLAA